MVLYHGCCRLTNQVAHFVVYKSYTQGVFFLPRLICTYSVNSWVPLETGRVRVVHSLALWHNMDSEHSSLHSGLHSSLRSWNSTPLGELFFVAIFRLLCVSMQCSTIPWYKYHLVFCLYTASGRTTSWSARGSVNHVEISTSWYNPPSTIIP